MKKNYFVLLAVLGIALSACSSPNKSESKSQTSSLPDFNLEIELLNDIQGLFDTQTTTQSSYLHDDYKNIDQYGNGATENSKPNALDFAWRIDSVDAELTGLKLNIYELKDDERVDTVTYLLDKDANNASVTNFKTDTYYEWSITAISDDKSVESEPVRFHTEDGTVRFIDIDGVSNVRDCGGWTGLDGKKIKQGLLYRGEEFNKQNYGCTDRQTSSSSVTDPTIVDPDESIERAKEKPYGQKITAKGINTVVNELKIKTEVDIRGYETYDYETRVNDHPTECGGLHDGRGIILDINYVINPVHTNRDKIYYDNYGKAACKKFFSMLADEDTYLPVYFHCAQGKDRTGFLAYLFEAFLGCSNEDMMRDYLLSNLSTTGSVSISKINNNYNYVDYLDGKEVSTQSGVKYQAEGETTAERAYNYLLSCGLTNEQLDSIRETFLED